MHAHGYLRDVHIIHMPIMALHQIVHMANEVLDGLSYNVLQYIIRPIVVACLYVHSSCLPAVTLINYNIIMNVATLSLLHCN